jgi:predicted nucleic acid-binding protein
MDIILDSSALISVILNEPNKSKVVSLTKNAMLLSSEVISFEIGNALINLYRRRRITEEQVLEAYKIYTSIPIRTVNVNIEKALKIACKYNLYAYDAYYLEIAHRLKLPLITFDELMKKTGASMKIFVMENLSEEEE